MLHLFLVSCNPITFSQAFSWITASRVCGTCEWDSRTVLRENCVTAVGGTELRGNPQLQGGTHDWWGSEDCFWEYAI